MASCQKAKYEGDKKASSADYLTALSNVQRNATHQMPRNTVVKSFPYSSLFVIARAMEEEEEELEEEKDEIWEMSWMFHALVRVHVEKRLALSGM